MANFRIDPAVRLATLVAALHAAHLRLRWDAARRLVVLETAP